MFAPPYDPKRASHFRDALAISLVLGLVALTVVVVRQRAEIRRLSREVASGTEHAGVTVRTARTRSLGMLTPQPAAAMREASLSSNEGNAMRSPEAGRGFKSRAERPSTLARLLENPEFFQAFERHRQSGLDNRFAGLFRRLALGPEELAAFKRLLAEKDSVALEVVAVAETQPDGPLAPGIVNASVRAARAQVEDAIRASLGSDRYAVYRDYEQTQPQRAVVAQLEQRLSYSGAPLAPAQADALVRILSAHAPVSTETTAPAAVVVDTGAPAVLARLQSETSAARVSDAALAESQVVLSAPQVAALREIQTEQHASLTALQLIRDSLPVDDPRNGDTLRLILQ